MKKLVLLLVAGTAIGLASCGNNENTSTKEQIDSMAAYRTDTMAAALKAQNDSLINAMAKMRADTAMQANAAAPAANGATTAKQTTHTSVKTMHSTGSTHHATETQTTPPASNTKPTITKEQQEQQNNKFNER